MANKPLQSITFLDLPDTYAVPQLDTTLSVTGKAADAKATGDAVDELKSAIGEYLTDFFEIGGYNISASGWSYANSNSRVRNILPFHFKQGDVVGLNDYTDATFYVGWITDSGIYGTAGAWLSSDYTAQNDGYYVFTLRNATEVAQTDKNDLASLFHGYSLSEKLDDDALRVYRYTSDSVFKSLFEPKGYNSTTNKFVDSNNRLSITHVQYIKDGGVIFAKNDYLFAVLLSNADGTLISDSGWQSRYIIPSNSYIRMTFRRSDNGNVSLSEVSGLRFDVFNYSRFDVTDAEIEKCNKHGANVVSINHRGWSECPENTLIAFKTSRRKGFEYVETDVQFTSDGVPVLLHDATINRTARNADGTTISNTINIGDITYEQALTYDFGIYKGSIYAGTKIPTLRQFIQLCKNLGLSCYVEIKDDVEYTTSQINQIMTIVRSCGMLEKTTFISANGTYLAQIKDTIPSQRIGYVRVNIADSGLSVCNGLKTGTNYVFIDSSTFSEEGIEKCIAANVPLEVWTINDISSILTLDPYITGVTSDNLNAAEVLYDNNI